MNRVDYLSCRISQLRRLGARTLWAQWLARLELGERPAGQELPPAQPVSSISLAAIAGELSARRDPTKPPAAQA